MSKPHEDDDDDYESIEGRDFFRQMYGRRTNIMNPTYLLPADDDEIQRSNLMHRLIRFIFSGRIYVGPTKEVLQFGPYRQVLDLGTGRGEWAVELCEEFSWVFVTGVDIVPIQYLEVPVRCRFELWDINTHDMPYANGCFDLVHARAVLTGIRDYPRFLSQIGRILRPGGLVLLIEPSLVQYAQNKPEHEYTFGTGPRGWFTLWETYRSCLSMLGVDVTVPLHLKELLEYTGLFEDIQDFKATIPVGFYHEQKGILTVGQLQWMAYDLLLPALKPMFLSLGMLEARADRIIKDAQSDLYYGNTDFKLASHMHIVGSNFSSYPVFIHTDKASASDMQKDRFSSPSVSAE
ncbi:Secondary metabolism regulator LAE1 [Mycena sanguinolenta]|uniref:Secondary metabolism regulator LAE1 n=1 Tax=Mycena sanguinolenta TaxID=230812 RepID=A0A8H6YGZ3_9AGAR|nr:Secondary metabolism regulator LAE1 [Mycena sanguinolenta]